MAQIFCPFIFRLKEIMWPQLIINTFNISWANLTIFVTIYERARDRKMYTFCLSVTTITLDWSAQSTPNFAMLLLRMSRIGSQNFQKFRKKT
jgi:hypothetical protein